MFLRPLQPSDVPAWAALAGEVFAATYRTAFPPATLTRYITKAFSPQTLAASLSNPAISVLGAWQAETLLGFSQVTVGEAPTAVTAQPARELNRLYVSANQQGTGVAGQLLAAALAASPAPLWLYVWEQNARAIAFYRKWRFVQVGEADLNFEGIPFHDLILQIVGARHASPLPSLGEFYD